MNPFNLEKGSGLMDFFATNFVVERQTFSYLNDPSSYAKQQYFNSNDFKDLFIKKVKL